MHLPGKSDTGDGITSDSRFLEGAMDGNSAGPPPISGILLRPTQVRRSERRVIVTPGRNQSPLFVDDQGASSACPNIDSEEADISSCG